MKRIKKSIFQIILLILIHSASAQAPDGYYDNAEGLQGEELKTALHKIINNHTVRAYAEFRDTILPDLDEDPDNSDNIILFYKNNSIPKSNFASNNEADFWNREHTWPSSHGFSDNTDTAYTDVHNLRPSDATVNSSKSNKDFDDIENSAENAQGEAPDTYTNSDFWEPRDNIKGDVARILLYMDVRYNSSRLDLSVEDRITFSGDPEIGVLYTLLRWHNDDPVDDYEANRHNKAYTYQNNRNPFVDHPEYVESIWGDVLEPRLSENLTNFSTDFGTVLFGNSKTQTYVLNAYNLESDVIISIDPPFSLSLDGNSFAQEISMTNETDNSAQSADIYIRFEPSNADGSTYSGTIRHTATNATTLAINVSGKEGELETLSIAQARTNALGSEVKVAGVVIDKGNNSSNSRVIHDGTGGIVVRSFDTNHESANLKYGDSVLVVGGLSEYGNLLQIEESPITIALLKENALQPSPKLITIADIDESLESELVTIENVSFSDAGDVFAGGGSAGNFDISDETGSVVFRVGSSSHPLVGTTIDDRLYTITGFVGQFFDDYQISVRDIDDLIIQEEPIITIEEARSRSLNSAVSITGTIIGGENNDPHNRVLFDGTAGIVVRSLIEGQESANLTTGDSVVVFGEIDDYFGTLQLSEGSITITKVGEGKTIAPAQLIEDLTDVGEPYESELVMVENVIISGANGNFAGGGSAGIYPLSKDDATSSLFIGSIDHPLVDTAIPSLSFSLTGFVSQLNDDYRISPRNTDDLVLDPLSFDFDEYVRLYPNPVLNTLNLEGYPNIDNLSIMNLHGQLVLSLTEVIDQVDVSHLEQGLYILSFNSNGRKYLSKILKK